MTARRPPATTVLAPDRHRRLLAELERGGSASVLHLARELCVSAATVRRDLALLESGGRLVRARGGAYPAPVLDRPSAPVLHADAKHRIGRAAAGRLTDGMTVMVLAGSTTAALVPHLGGRSLTVVTNGLDIAHALAGHPDVTLILLGGILNRDQMTLLGPMTEQGMADLHVEVMFAGAYGIDPDVGVTGAKVVQAGYHHSMLRHTDSLVVLADASKFGRRGPTRLARLDQVDAFVTDTAHDDPVVGVLRAAGATVEHC